MKTYDIITLGETMLRLSPPGLKRIEQSTEMAVEVGGSESNVAIGLARLGLKTLWLSRLTDNSLGRLVEQQIRRHGVDTSNVIWTEEDRVGLYFLEEGRAPRTSRVIYDRTGSAFSRIQPHELPEDVFQSARHLHLTGITPALSPSAAATARRALELAKGAGATVSFDLNYRRLWTAEAARDGCDFFMKRADLLFVPQGDAQLIYPVGDAAPDDVAEWLAGQFPQATIVATLGGEGALARTPTGESIRQSAFRADPVGRVGGGDAFAAGFLYGYLAGQNKGEWVRNALRWGVAAAAMKYTMVGDIPFIERAEIEALLSDEESGGGGLRR